MTDDVIPEDAQRFINDYIDSIAQWEALLLLRSNAQVEWNVAALAQRLYIAPPEAERLLAKLLAQGFLAASDPALPSYKYQPTSPELERMVSHVADLYARSLVPVTHLIHSKPKTKVQQFADAFRLRKD